MAGFTGICSANVTTSEQAVKNAAQATVYAQHTVVDVLCAGHDLIIAKSSISILNERWMQLQKLGISIWVDGEVYNQAELAQQPGETFSETVLAHYQQGTLASLLAKVDGVFIVVIYDNHNQTLSILTDRYGIKPFYLYARNNSLIFATELKCFPFFESFKLKIRADVVDSFIDLEHLMGTATWFEGVELVEPATIYTYHIVHNRLDASRYWSWAAIKPNSIPLAEASEYLGELLQQAIRKRAYGNYRVGVGLSGGFDSRAILATIRDQKPITYTFGIPESADVKIAKRVAAIAGVKNVHFDMRVEHWLQKRFTGIWKVDGMLNAVHMHYSHLMDEIPKIMDVNLSGFVGDGVLGQNYIVKKGKSFLNKRITDDIASHYYGKHIHFSNTRDSFFDADKTDAYLFYNRGRRLTGLGLEEAAKTIAQRIPFMDVNLLDFAYSLPDEYRAGNKVYYRALLNLYPEFYKNIPHANTGTPINLAPGLLFQAEKKIHWAIQGVRHRLGITNTYSDAGSWLKEPRMTAFIKDLLNRKKALYANLTDNDYVALYVEPHLRGELKKVKPLMGAISLEIWLQQILNKKHLTL
jgi:asparagine synthase (glutamine-hydrolysing)